MKPKTRLEKRVAELSGVMPEETPEQEKWAFDNLMEHKAFATKSSAFCLDCGKTFSLALISRGKVTCPHCSTRLTVTKTKRTTDYQCSHFSIAYVVEEFQVSANFKISATYKKGIPARINVLRLTEDWIKPDGKCTKIGLLRTTSWNANCWSGNWEIRKNSRWHAKYDIYPAAFHPRSKFTAELKKYGVSKFMQQMSLHEAIRLLPHNPKLETLLKARQHALLGFGTDESYFISRYWPSIRICLRNKYTVKNARMWFDYLRLLENFRKDLLNSKYVCPKDLKKEHDRLLAKQQEQRRIKELEEKKRRAIDAQKAYAERIKNVLGLEFTNGEILIKILETVQEFEEEGRLLKHCVFESGYYERENSLIFSARLEGVPIETIEISIPEFKIVQARGLRNAPSEYNKKIVSLVKKNIPRIKKAWKGKLQTA